VGYDQTIVHNRRALRRYFVWPEVHIRFQTTTERVAKTQRRAYVRRTPRKRAVEVDTSVGSGVICTPKKSADLLNDRPRLSDVKGANVSVPASRTCMTWNAAPVSESYTSWT
jgi:hypothetical protein